MSIGTSYFGSRIPRHVGADMERLAEQGFTGVLHVLTENDLEYYRGTMAEIVRLSHACGLEVLMAPWAVCELFGGEAESRFGARHPQYGQVLDDGDVVPASCPNQPAVRAVVHGWIEAAVAFGADRLLCDEPHWVHPHHFDRSRERWGCRCSRCQALFAQRFGFDMPVEFTDEVRSFREASMVDFIGDFVAHATSAGGRTSVCLLPLTGGQHGILDWGSVAALPGLDTFGTDPYWRAFDKPAEPFVSEYADRVVSLAREHDVTAQLWIQGFRLDAADADDVRAAVRIARDAGIEDIWTWGFEACAHMSALAGDDPAVIWDALCEELTGRVAR